jgi:catechol 2,3-dioxygenase-like lactoylglutathione lyase family enzyme
MLSDARVHAALPATDLERARRFYADKLGLTPADENAGGLFYDGAGGTRFLVFPTQGKASGEHTQVGFLVDDIDAEVADLRARGVVFEEYDLPGFKTVDGIAEAGPTRGAWLKDSEGNLLGIVQFVG